MKKLKEFSYKQIKDYVFYVGDSYSCAGIACNGKLTSKMMDAFYEINKWIRIANKNYDKTR